MPNPESANHDIFLIWDKISGKVIAAHAKPTAKPKVGDTITFRACAAVSANIAVAFANGSNFDPSPAFTITDSNPHPVIRLGDFDFTCSVSVSNTVSIDNGDNSGTQSPEGGHTEHPGPHS